MKLKELQTILCSRRGAVQFAIVYEAETSTELESGCSVEYAIKHHGDREVKRIGAVENQILIVVERK